MCVRVCVCICVCACIPPSQLNISTATAATTTTTTTTNISLEVVFRDKGRFVGEESVGEVQEAIEGMLTTMFGNGRRGKKA